MAAAVHSNVGLMHATMAMFNAWCDRMPVLVLGATGPVDAPKRRPWIDWIHTARDQGALVRPYTKWDDQPASAEAAREALLRACWLARTAPMGPVYVNLDAGMQEAPLGEPLPPIDRGPLRAGGEGGGRAGAGGPGGGMAARRPPAGAPDRPGLARRAGLGEPRVAGGGVAGAGGDRPKMRGSVPDRSSAARRCPGDLPGAGGRAGHQECRCRPEPRLGGPGGHAEGRVRYGGAAGQGDQRHARPPDPQRLEHGPPGIAAGRPVHRRRCRHSRRGAAGTAAGWSDGAGCGAPAAGAGAGAWSDHRCADDACAAPGGRRPTRVAAAPVAVLERGALAVPPSARLCRRRRRRRHRRRARHRRRRGARPARHRAGAGRRCAATATS